MKNRFLVISGILLFIFLIFSVGVSGDLPKPVSGIDSTVIAIPGAGKPLSLEECIKLSLESNALLFAEKDRLEELNGKMIQSLSTGLPYLGFNGTWSRGRDPSFAMNESFSMGPSETSSGSPFDSLLAGMDFMPNPEDIPAQTFWRTGLQLHWEIRPALVWNAVGAAGLGVDRENEIIRDVSNRTVEAVMTGYYGLVMIAEQIEALDAEIEAKKEFLEISRQRFELGLSTSLDTLRAAVSFANLVPQRRSAIQALHDAGARLNGLMGRPEHTPLTVDKKFIIEEGTINSELALKQVGERPDITQLEYLKRIMVKNKGAKKSARHPYLSADASYGFVTSNLDELTQTGHDYWNVSLTLGIPIFDGLLARGEIHEASAAVARIEHQLEDARLNARMEIDSILGRLEAARANLAAARMNVRAADEAFSQVKMNYELGRADYLAVLNMQAERFMADTNLIQAKNEVLTLTVSLKRALGFSPDVPLAKIIKELRG